MNVQVHLDLTAGVQLLCEDCGRVMMAGVSHHARAMVMHALPLCEGFKQKAFRQVHLQVQGLAKHLELELPDAP